jgi:hydrogenase maturation factor
MAIGNDNDRRLNRAGEAPKERRSLNKRDPKLGKVDRDFLTRVLLKSTGAKSDSVIVGPGMGLDNAVLSVGGGRVMVVTADPLSIIPSIGMERSAWLTVHELASDLTTSAVRPQFAVLDFNLPPSLKMADFERYIRAVSDECGRLGISIVGGHTGRYPGSDFSIVGGGVLMGLSEDDRYLTPRMMQDGDEIIMTKGAAIEATAVLSLAFPRKTERALGSKTLAEKARGYLGLCSTVEDALAACSVGIKEEGVTSMHDATEGGVLGALYELARSSGRELSVESGSIHVSEESSAVCAAFRLDPLVTLSEGTLIITCRPRRSEEVLRALSGKGIAGFRIGRVVGRGPRGGRLSLSSVGGRAREFSPPKFDPYWGAYAEGVENGWK